jgi:hypothetical protein
MHMTKTRKAMAGSLILLPLALSPSLAGAMCMNPDTGISGYKIPLTLEIRETRDIVIGRVVADKALQEDPDDPEGITAQEISIQVLKRLKGNLPNVFIFRNINTSARYPIGMGERHVLFVSRTDNQLWVNACGNSTLTVQAPQLARQIQGQLQNKTAPLRGG